MGPMGHDCGEEARASNSDLEVSSEKIDQLRMEAARKLAKRQSGLVASNWGDGVLERADDRLFSQCSLSGRVQKAVLFGDPRINFNAGDQLEPKFISRYTAREGLVGVCAREGVSLKGFLYA